MLFITNRHFKEGKVSKKNRKVTFDEKDNEPATSVFFCERRGKSDYVELMADGFFKKLQKMNKDGKCDQVLLYIHGFNNFPNEKKNQIFDRAETMQSLIDEDVRQGGKRHIVVIPMIWPCDNDLGITLDYFDDQKAAEASSAGFARVLGLFLKWRDKMGQGPGRASGGNRGNETPCTVRINLIAHSMGNRVLRYTLASWANDYGSVPMLFRNVFLAAADIANESLEPGEPGEHIPESTRNVIVYHASDDLALRSSKVTNLKNKVVSKRLGHSGPEDMSKVRDNVYAVDCDNFNNSYDTPTGHSYFLTGNENLAGKKSAGVVFQHMLGAMKTGRPETSSDRRLILNDYDDDYELDDLGV